MSISKNKLSQRLNNIEGALKGIQDALMFTMTTMRVRIVHGSGLTGPDNQPLPGVVQEGSLLDMYRDALAKANAKANAATKPLVTVD